MKKSKKFLGLTLVLSMFMMIFSGCTKQEQSFMDVMKNAQNMKSYESKADVKFNISLVSGGTEDEKKTMAQVAPVVNSLKIAMDSKIINNDDAIKAYANFKVDNSIMPVGFETWIDMNKSGDMKEIIKSKELFDYISNMDPAAKKIFGGKEYFVVDTKEMMDGMMKQPEFKKSGMDTVKLQKTIANYTKGIEELSKHVVDVKIKTGDAGIVSDKGDQTVKVNGEDVKAKLYEVKINDSDLKKLLVLNKDFAKDNEALVKEFKSVILDYMFGIMDSMPKEAGMKPQTKEELQKEMDKGIEEMSESTAKFMAAMKNAGDIKILGDKGITLNYYVKDGNIVKANEKYEFVVDMPKLIKLSQDIEKSVSGKKVEAKTEGQPTGVYSLTMEANSEIFNINKLDTIKMPELNAKNSISIMQIMNEAQKSMETVQKTATVKPAVVKPAAKTVNITVSKKSVLKNAYVPADTLKSVKGSVVNSKGIIKLSVNGKVVTGKLNTSSFVTSNNKVYVSIKVLKGMGVNIIVK